MLAIQQAHVRYRQFTVETWVVKTYFFKKLSFTTNQGDAN